MSAKRMLDVTLAGIALIVVAPLLALLAIGIRLAGPGPVFYRAQRGGRGSRPVTMYKLRTMRIGGAATTVITAQGDPSIFPFGRRLRHRPDLPNRVDPGDGAARSSLVPASSRAAGGPAHPAAGG